MVRFARSENTLIVEIVGELDHHCAEYIRYKIDNEILKSSAKHLVFDFSQVSFMDSSGIGVIMGRYKNIIKSNGKVGVCNLNDHIRRVFEMAGMNRFIPIYDTIDIAKTQV